MIAEHPRLSLAQHKKKLVSTYNRASEDNKKALKHPIDLRKDAMVAKGRVKTFLADEKKAAKHQQDKNEWAKKKRAMDPDWAKARDRKNAAMQKIKCMNDDGVRLKKNETNQRYYARKKAAII